VLRIYPVAIEQDAFLEISSGSPKPQADPGFGKGVGIGRIGYMQHGVLIHDGFPLFRKTFSWVNYIRLLPKKETKKGPALPHKAHIFL